MQNQRRRVEGPESHGTPAAKAGWREAVTQDCRNAPVVPKPHEAEISSNPADARGERLAVEMPKPELALL